MLNCVRLFFDTFFQVFNHPEGNALIRNSPEGEHMIGHMELGVEYVHVRGVPTGMPTLEGIIVVPEMQVKPSVYNFAQKKIEWEQGIYTRGS